MESLQSQENEMCGESQNASQLYRFIMDFQVLVIFHFTSTISRRKYRDERRVVENKTVSQTQAFFFLQNVCLIVFLTFYTTVPPSYIAIITQ